MTDEKLMERWGVTARTLGNWRTRGEERGDVPPLAAEDPRELVEWYRAAYGKEAPAKVRAAAERMLGDRPAVELLEVVIDAPAVEVLARALDKLGLSQTLARLVEEDERAWEELLAAREAGAGIDGAKRRWIETTELKRAAQKTEDAVQLALELCKGWIRTEWEPGERARRNALQGSALAAEDLDRLRAAGTDRELADAWDRALERGLK